jgi:6-phospho-beta-glucosidase
MCRLRPRRRDLSADISGESSEFYVKLAFVGGGGFRTPLVFGALLDRAERLAVDELVLHDVEQVRLERITEVLDGLSAEQGARVPFRSTLDLEDAVDGADVVFCAIRVGGLDGRVEDERIPLAEGLLGQETVGAGGISFALRTVPVMLSIAETVAERAPDAWFVNFTNPAGLVTEALQPALGTRAVGICDGPESLFRGVARALGRARHELWFDYFGLNHLGWLRGVYDRGRDLLPGLLADEDRLASFAEGRMFGAEVLRVTGMVPMEYLWYFHHTDEAIAAVHERGVTRAEVVRSQQHGFYAAGRRGPADALRAWRETLVQRNASYMAEAGKPDVGTEEDAVGYEHVALDVVEAVSGRRGAVLVVNTTSRGSLPFLDEDAVVEVPCFVSEAGIFPFAVGDVPDRARELVETVKEVERLTIEAARTGSRELAERALARHPLVGSAEKARRMVACYRASGQKNSQE